MGKLRGFRSGSVMHLYWGYPQGRNYIQLWTIFLKLLIFKFFSHFVLFGSFGIYAKGTNFILGTPYTYRDAHKDRYRHTCACLYTSTHTHKCACGKSMTIVTSIVERLACLDEHCIRVKHPRVQRRWLQLKVTGWSLP